MQYINTIKSKESIISLENSMDGVLTFELEGNTMYKRADGSYTDTWEKGCTLESVGESEGNKIEVLSRGENLFNGNELAKLNPSLFSFAENVLTIDDAWSAEYKNPIKFIPNTSYTISGILKIIKKGDGISVDKSARLFLKIPNSDKTISLFYLSNIGDLDVGDIVEIKYRFVAPNDVNKYTHILLYSLWGEQGQHGTIQLINFKIEKENTTIASYEPYKEDKINILSTEPLRGLPNGIRDIASKNTVTRKLGIRPYHSGDENNANVITDRINTVYQLPTPIVENLIVQKGDI